MTVKSTDPQSPAAAPEAAGTPDVPALPVRASIYIDVDGTVHFGALFEELLPVARALGGSESVAPSPSAPRVAPSAAAPGVAPSAAGLGDE